MKKLYFFIHTLISITIPLINAQPATITNVFVHHGPNRERIVLYLNHMPKVIQKNNSIILSNIDLSPEFLKYLNKARAPWYKTIHTYINKQLTCTVHSHARNIHVDYKTCLNIHKKPTVGITIKKNKTNHTKKNLIVIDCGHGGHDLGAHAHNIYEKDIVLKIGTLVAQQLRSLGYKTFMTRTDDTFVSLDTRTSLANMKRATVFISIHCNADVDKTKRGITVFYESEHSAGLARHIHAALSKPINGHQIIDHGIKRELAQVLYGTCMPAIIAELLFVSNTHDAQLLKDFEIQQLLAQRLTEGINAALKQLKLTKKEEIPAQAALLTDAKVLVHSHDQD